METKRKRSGCQMIVLIIILLAVIVIGLFLNFILGELGKPAMM